MDVDAIIRKAYETNRRRDLIDRENGFATPDQGPLGMRLQTVEAAIEAGLRMEDWACVAEGLVMLRDVIGSCR